MKIIIIGVLALGSFTAFAGDVKDCQRAVALSINNIEQVTAYSEKIEERSHKFLSAGYLDVAQEIYNNTESKLAERIESIAKQVCAKK